MAENRSVERGEVKKEKKMNQRPRLILLLISLLIIALGIGLPADVIKIGSIAPSRSLWDKALTDLASEWAKISGGSIQLKIYPGGIVGGEMDMLTKMRLGTLNGAVFTIMGMTAIYPDAFVLNTPFLMNSDEEFNYVFERIKPDFEKQIEARDFIEHAIGHKAMDVGMPDQKAAESLG